MASEASFSDTTSPAPSRPAEGPIEGFEVAGWIDRLGRSIGRHRRFWTRLGNLETRIVAAQIEQVQVDRPVYVSGLARSGSTILLELLAGHPQAATHRYRDYPPIFTPYLWNRWLDRIPKRDERPVERTHKDGIAVTSESPEAFEEGIWMAFFPSLHDPGTSSVLGREDEDQAFDAFYRDHIRKLLAIRGRPRYVAKGNYNTTRLGYLHRLFPDARFVIPVRDPLWHIASLMKQQGLFERGQRQNPKARRHLQLVGHFEFGLDRRPINTGDEAAVRDVLGHWQRGEEVAGWARYWAAIHSFLADQLEADAALRDACLVVRYEDFCAAPRETMAAMLAHCELEDEGDALVEAAAARVHPPGYYKPAFLDTELEIIREETAAAAARFGYGV